MGQSALDALAACEESQDESVASCRDWKDEDVTACNLMSKMGNMWTNDSLNQQCVVTANHSFESMSNAWLMHDAGPKHEMHVACDIRRLSHQGFIV